MSSMPIIDDRMVDLFRRTGKRRASFRPAQGGRRGGPQRVFLQVTKCSGDGFCITKEGNPGRCINGICIKTPFPGPNPFEFLD
jgi:hypothetical protein